MELPSYPESRKILREIFAKLGWRYPLSTRLSTCLLYSNLLTEQKITTALFEWDKDAWMRMPNFGEKTYNEVKGIIDDLSNRHAGGGPLDLMHNVRQELHEAYEVTKGYTITLDLETVRDLRTRLNACLISIDEIEAMLDI